MPVCAREAAERGDQEAEDADEDEVGAERADGVDQAQHAHEDEEEGPGGVEADRVEAAGRVARVGGVVAECAGLGLEGEAEGDPEGAEGAEDDAGEGVAEDPLWLRWSARAQLLGGVCSRWHTSPMAPRIMRIPPKARYVPIPAEPFEAPRQPMRSQESGVKESKNPQSALSESGTPIHRALQGASRTYTGVGLPKVLRRSPATLFWGPR